MVVRFLPTTTDPVPVADDARGDLAEVIELRARLPRAVRDDAAQSAGVTVTPESVAKLVEVTAETAVGTDSPSAAALESAMLASVRLLARRPLSSGELRRELLGRGHPEHDVEEAIAECETSLYLDDLGLARVVCENLRERKGASRSQVRVKLRERLLPYEIIEVALGELDDNAEWELLRAAAADRARKLAGLERPVAERRLLGYLARRGWSGEAAVRAVRAALDTANAPGGVRFQ